MNPKQHRIPRASTRRTRQLRRDSTIPERLLWGRLRAGQLAGLKFRRQQVIGPYVVDFYSASAKLVVECDGRTHIGRAREDARRTRYLEEQGLRVVRVTDDEVIRDPDARATAIGVAAGLEI